MDAIITGAKIQNTRQHKKIWKSSSKTKQQSKSTMALPRLRPGMSRSLVIPLLAILLICCCWTEAQNESAFNRTKAHVEQHAKTRREGDIVDISDEATAADAILFPWFVQFLGCVTLFILRRFDLPFPYAAIMFIWGMIMGGVVIAFGDPNDHAKTNALNDSIRQWVNIDPNLLLLVFLPGLLFKDAVEIPINLFLAAIGQIFTLAYPMVFVGTALVAVAARYCLPYCHQAEREYYDWWAWLTLGAILSSTDPIAVASVLKTAGASPRLVMHIAGESLLNDGSSYVLFILFANLWYKDVSIIPDHPNAISSISAAIGFFFKMSLGGIAVGAAFGACLLVILSELDRRMEREFDIVQVVMGITAAYLCYYVCDELLTFSGIIGTVTLGLIVNYFGRGMVNDEELMASYLALAEFLLNTLLFALGGAIWAAVSFTPLSYRVVGMDFVWLVVFFILVVVIRFIQVGLFYPILSRIGLKSNWKESVFLAYGGLHGSVGVALGLHLVTHVFENTTIEQEGERAAATIMQFLGGGVTLLTLSINGSTSGVILKQLGLSKPPISAEHTKKLFEGTAKDYIYGQIANLFQEPRFQNVNFAVLVELVPYVTKEPPRMSNTSETGGHPRGEAVHVFNQRIAGDGEPYLNLLEATRRTSSYRPCTNGVVSEDSKDDESGYDELECEKLLVEMRQIFLDLLREAYKLELELGELDEKEHNGYLFHVLMQSVDLANNEVEHEEKPIEDWKHTRPFFSWNPTGISASFRISSRSSARTRTSIVADGTENFEVRTKPPSPNVASSLFSVFSDGHTEDCNTEKHKLSAKRIRLHVLRAIAFKHAHAMAESKMQLYANRFDDQVDASMQARHEITQATLQNVLAESRAQVALADEMLEREVSDHDYEIILSHYCAKILIRRLMKFTERKADDGLLGKQEARSYLGTMKTKLQGISSRTVERLADSIHEKHSGSSDNDIIPEDGSGKVNSNSTNYSSSATDSQVDPSTKR